MLPDFLPRIVQWHVKMSFFDVLYPQVVPTGLGFFNVIHNFLSNLMAKSSRSTLTSPGGI